MGCRIPIIPKCCCCIPLRIGCLIIGYVNMVASCISLAGSSYFIYSEHAYVQASKLTPVPGRPLADIEKEALGLYICYGYYLVAFTFNFLLNLTLVIGVHLNNPKMLKAFCIVTLVLFTLGLGLVVVTAMYMGILATIGIGKWCLALLFVAIIVRSARLEMEAENKPPMQEMKNLNIVQQAPLMA